MGFPGCVVKFLCMIVVLPSVVDSVREQSNNEVTVKWGVADGTAVVGKVFRLHIPSDAFDGTVLYYTVKNIDGSPLSSWLMFDAKTSVLQGIPGPSDAGQLYLDITAHGRNSQASVTSTIYVREVPSYTSGAPMSSHMPDSSLKFKTVKPEFVWCKQTESETVATILIDADLDMLSVPDKLNLLSVFLSHMELHEGMVKMMPLGTSPLHDSSALVSGTGDSLSPKTPGLFISWPVGCGQVKEGHFPVLQKLDEDSASGKMAKVLGYSVIGWRVTNSHFLAPTRKRRQVKNTPTPSLTPVMPTKAITKPETVDKMTHSVVDGQSPTFIQPTATQPPMGKTDEPFVIPPVDTDKTQKIMPTEATPIVVPISRTEEMPHIKPTKTRYPLEPTDVPNGGIGDSCIRGQQPQVKTHLLEFNYNIGQIIDTFIPEDTFEDCKVGDTRNLMLELHTDKDSIIPSHFFLQFNSSSQKIFGLPMKQDVGVHKFKLLGKKPSGLAANTWIKIIIKESPEVEINHELSITINYDYNTFKSSAVDKVFLAHRLADIYGDADASKLQITKIQQGSVIYGWTNSSVTKVGCPSAEIKTLVRKLVNADGTLTKLAIEKIHPFHLYQAHAKPAGDCTNDPSFPVTISSENVAKGSTGHDNSDNTLIITVISVVAVVLIVIIALIIACVIYHSKRKGKMNVDDQNTFTNRKPVIFSDEVDDKPCDVNKPLLVESSPAAPAEYHRGTSESPEPQISGTYRNLSASTPADDCITEMPEKPYEPPPPVTAPNNGRQPRPSYQQQPYSQAPKILP